MQNSRYFGLAAASTTAVAWGAMFGILAQLLTHIDLFWLTSLRYGIATPVLIVLLLIFEGRSAFRLDRRWMLLAVIGTLTIVGFNVGVLTGMKLSGPEHGALMVALGPAMVALIQWIRTRVAPKTAALAAIAAAFTGVAIVATNGNIGAILHGGSLTGDCEIAAGVFCFAIYSAYSSSFADWSWLRFTTLSLGLGTLSSFVATAAATATGFIAVPHVTLDAAFVWGILYMSFIAVVVAFAAWNYAIRSLGPQNTILFLNAVPVVSFAVAVLTGRRLSAFEYIGAALTVGALVMFNLASRAAPRKASTSGELAA